MKRKAAAAAKNAPAPGMAAAPAPQPPFQVGAVPASGGKNDGDAASGVSRRFLCYNMMGTVITTGEAGSDFNSVEMAFHDTSRAGRVPTITRLPRVRHRCPGRARLRARVPGQVRGRRRDRLLPSVRVLGAHFRVARDAPRGRTRHEPRRGRHVGRRAHLGPHAPRLLPRGRAATDGAARGRPRDVRGQGRVPRRGVARGGARARSRRRGSVELLRTGLEFAEYDLLDEDACCTAAGSPFPRDTPSRGSATSRTAPVPSRSARATASSAFASPISAVVGPCVPIGRRRAAGGRTPLDRRRLCRRYPHRRRGSVLRGVSHRCGAQRAPQARAHPAAAVNGAVAQSRSGVLRRTRGCRREGATLRRADHRRLERSQRRRRRGCGPRRGARRRARRRG